MLKDNLITKYVKVRSCRLNENTVNVAVLKKRATKKTILYFQKDSVIWEQYYRNDYFSKPFRTVFSTSAQLTEHSVKFVVVVGRPLRMCGLDVGKFRSISRYDEQAANDKYIYVGTKKEFKQKGIRI